MSSDWGNHPLFEQPRWALLLPHLYIARGKLGVNGPRHRLQVRPNAPPEVFELEAPCPTCGRVNKIVRPSKNRGTQINLSPSCPLDVNVACARSPKAHQFNSYIRSRMEAQ